MARHDNAPGKTLRARRQHIGLVEFVEDRRTEEADVDTKRTDNADQNRQDKIEPTAVAPDREGTEPIGEKELSRQHPDDVVDAHQHGRSDENHLVDELAAIGRGKQGEDKRHERAACEDRQGQRERRTDTALQDVRHRLVELGRITEISAAQSLHEIEELRIEDVAVADDERLVIAVTVIEFRDGFRRGVLAENRQGRRTADNVEEKKGQQKDAERGRNHFKQPSADILPHPDYALMADRR